MSTIEISLIAMLVISYAGVIAIAYLIWKYREVKYIHIKDTDRIEQLLNDKHALTNKLRNKTKDYDYLLRCYKEVQKENDSLKETIEDIYQNQKAYKE